MWSIRWCSWLSLGTILVQWCHADVTKSTQELRTILDSEVRFASVLCDYSRNVGDPVLIAHCSHNYPDGHRLFHRTNISASDLEEYISHPLNALGVMMRTTVGLIPIGDRLHQTSSESKERVRREVLTQMSRFGQPQDMMDACGSLVILQETYQLETRDLIEGKVQLDGRQHLSDYRLSPVDMHFIAVSAANMKRHRLGREWIEAAVEHWPLGQNKKHQFGDVSADWTKLTNLNTTARPNQFRALYDTTLDNTLDNFNSMCLGGSRGWRHPRIDAKYSCRFEHHGHPFLRLGPFKLEELHDRPFMILVHDFTAARENRRLKATVSAALQGSTYGDVPWRNSGMAKASPGFKDFTRTSKQGWITDRRFVYPVTNTFKGDDGRGTFQMNEVMKEVPHPVGRGSNKFQTITSPDLAKVSARIGLMTRMRVDYPLSSEPYQVANYGLGGRYTPHLDTTSYACDAKKPVAEEMKLYMQSKGDRIATVMVYLSNVEMGGGTVFPLLGIRSLPVEGDAIFWLNTLSDGSCDLLTKHGGCPVLVGSKWISNKWIGYNDQGLEHNPCGLREKDQFNTFDEWRAT